MTWFLTIEDVIAIHDLQIADYGGANGLRDMALLEAAVYRPQSGYYETEIEMAAALWESLSQNHPFVDGNKRTAVLATLTFLTMNGYEWAFEDEDMLTFLSTRYETATMRYEELRPWLQQIVRKIS